MDVTIEGFILFMGEEPDDKIAEQFTIANRNFELAFSMVAEVMKCAPDCPYSDKIYVIQGPTGTNITKMFSYNGDWFADIPNGTRCDWLANTNIEGTSFYKLNCKGNIGYVNTQWARSE
jgi:hypothetical protein